MINGKAQNLILFGYKGSGKTFFGNLLAQEVGSFFIDTDQLLEERYKHDFKEELTCRQISIQWGEGYFRELEAKVIDDLAGIHNTILAVGGGAVLKPENRLKLAKIGTLVFLVADKTILKTRLLVGPLPSFIDAQNPENSFEQMYRERMPIYEKASQCKVMLDGKTNRQVLDELKALWKGSVLIGI